MSSRHKLYGSQGCDDVMLDSEATGSSGADKNLYRYAQ